ncbi:hypothetical protein COT77_01195 [Candidatus Berkelbacteria bacterium CG10_big_fil_rev_8_21_14_0_10_41_12]|uniref:DUF8173 domain-containing protein n=1 Tax=Candidatus Berkelbacteria bacterium CG10_big_fil_rev_8_21_14_0_10_41_12 TaxID=1974513 RepID=A0A2M6WXL4_9BACT|nr:MAG: hypothetical protein COT77_01195 [Candidatus Berkelbacteria bacterium CG10_big_fil_rev_8_21_14_0_10_41_12]
MKKIIIVIFVILAVPTFALAAEFRSNHQGTDTVKKGEVVKNLYIANQQVTIEANVQNDLYGAGQNIIINGDVSDDCFAAGTTVTVNGATGDSLKIAGSTLNLNGPVGSDLFAAGTTINFAKSANVVNDLLAAGTMITLDNKIGGNVKLAGSAIQINGTIGGDVYIAGVDKLTIGDNAVINGNLTYRSSQKAEISPNAKILGDTNYKPIDTDKQKQIGQFTRSIKALFTTLGLIKVVSIIILGLILISMFPKQTDNVVKLGYKQFGMNILYGIIIGILAPLGIFVLFVSVFGYMIALTALLAYLLLCIIAGVYEAIIVGSGIIKIFEKKDYRCDWRTIIIGKIAVVLIVLIPIIGWIGNLIFFLAALGALSRNCYNQYRLSKQTK